MFGIVVQSIDIVSVERFFMNHKGRIVKDNKIKKQFLKNSNQVLYELIKKYNLCVKAIGRKR